MSNAVTLLCRPVQLPPTQKAVLMCLADYCHDDGKDWHSIAALMSWTCLGKTTVIDALKALEARGLVAIDRRNGAKSTTFLQLQAIEATAPTETENQNGTRTGTGGAPVRVADSTGAGGVQTGAAPVQTGAGGAPEALEASEATEKQQPKRARAPKVPAFIPDDLLPDWLPVDAWKAYVLARVEMRKPMSINAQELAIKKLRRWHDEGHSARTILEQSVIGDWQGLFLPKEAGPNTEPAWRTERRERNEAFLGPFAAKRSRQARTFEDIDYTEGTKDGRIL